MKNIKIDKNKPIALYYQIEEILREKIFSGEIKEGEPIPTEEKLEKIFDVSRTTVRRAISNLERDGLLESKRAQGTFVKKKLFDEPVLGIRSYTEEAIKQGYIPSSKILSLKNVKPNDEVKAALKIEDNDRVFVLKRLRYLNNAPTAIDTTYIPVKLVPGLSKGDFKQTDKKQSLYYILENKYKLVLDEAEEIIDATITDPEESAILGLRSGSPINLRIRIIFLPDGMPLTYMKSIYRNRYKVRLKGRL
jgi:GntR family transcriptional regulator